MKSSEYFTKPVAVESSSREIAKAKMRVRNYWSILILLLILLLLFLMLRVIWYAPKLTATLGIKDENKDYKGEINIIIDPTEWTNGDVLVSVEYNKIVENAKKEISIDGGNTFVEYTEPIKVAQNTKIVARLVGVDDSNENEKHTANDVGADVSRDPQNDIEPEIIAEESLEIKNIDKLEPLDFNITASSKDDTILVGAKAEDAEETEENGKSEIKEYEYIIRRGDWEKRVVSIGNTCKFDKLQGGQTYKIQVYAIDNAGNKKASNEVEVTIKELARLRINPNGGTWEGSDKVKEVYQEYGTTKKIEEPTRIGYTFKKWVATDGGSIENNTYTFGEANGTITAEWEINQYTLTFDPNGEL